MKFDLRSLLIMPILALLAHGFWRVLDESGDELFGRLIPGSWMAKVWIAASNAGIPDTLIETHLIASLPDLPGMLLSVITGTAMTVSRIPCAFIFAALVPLSCPFVKAARDWQYFLNFGLLTAVYAIVVTAILCLVFWQTSRGSKQLQLWTSCGFWTLIAFVSSVGYAWKH